MSKIKELIWRIRLCFWLCYYGYSIWYHPRKTFKYSGDEIWLEMFYDKLSPHESVIEDLNS